MALLDILRYPDPRLRSHAKPVALVNDDIRTLVADMFETMYEAPGIGLAAVQVGVAKQVITIDISEDGDQPLVLINPEIIETDGSSVMDEGCLSVPGIHEAVKRAAYIRVRSLDREGQVQEIEAEDLLAVCIQHEIDHLDGKLFVDYLSSLKRLRVRKKLEKQLRQELRDSA
jgi:peptide deformylase